MVVGGGGSGWGTWISSGRGDGPALAAGAGTSGATGEGFAIRYLVVGKRFFILTAEARTEAAARTLAAPLFAQASAARARVTQTVDAQNRVALAGHVHPLARPEFDTGAAPDDLPMQRILLVLKRGPEQESALRQLLDQLHAHREPGHGRLPGGLEPRDHLVRNDRAEQMLARARRADQPIAVLYIDVDGFKHINDTFGHAVGDTFLKAVAARLETVVRAGDTAARLAGDEFVVRGPRPTEELSRRLLAEDIMGGLPLGRFYPDLADCALYCCTEMNTRAEIDHLVRALADAA